MTFQTTVPQLGRLCDRDFFYLSATHAEALVRLEYFVRQQWNFALLLGRGGSGRSSTLRAFRRRPVAQHSAVAIIDGSMASSIQFLAGLVTAWEIDCRPTEDLLTHWTAVEARLCEFWHAKKSPLIMVDNIDFAPFDVQQTIMRLASLPASLGAGIQFILTAHDIHLEQIDEQIRQRIDLRINLGLWDDDEIREFLFAALPQTKSIHKYFTADAISSLQRASGGVSRRVRQLLRLVLSAAESQGALQIDGIAIAAARSQLAS